MKEKTLIITKEIHELWLDAEKEAAFWGIDGLSYWVHNELGKAIYGDNLPKVKDSILESFESKKLITIESLKQFEVQK